MYTVTPMIAARGANERNLRRSSRSCAAPRAFQASQRASKFGSSCPDSAGLSAAGARATIDLLDVMHQATAPREAGTVQFGTVGRFANG